MSLEQHLNAHLGDLAPRFPHHIASLNLVYSSFTITGEDLAEISRRIGGFVRLNQPVTSDGYDWFWAAKFRLDSGSMVTVTFPWSQDDLQIGGSSMDRSIAVYAKPEIPDEEITPLLGELLNSFRDTRLIVQRP